jgi:hypothetical protein
LKNVAEDYLSRELDKVPYGRRHRIFAIIFVAEMVFDLVDGRGFPDAFGAALGLTIAIFLLAYFGSQIVDDGKRFQAFNSIAFALYFLIVFSRHQMLK